jgi:ribosomal protein S18 acetylase RimI-like enzyme
MPIKSAHLPRPSVHIRAAGPGDMAALLALENQIFATDRISRRSLRGLLRSPTADVIVAEEGQGLAGTAVLLYRPGSAIARLYSIGVAPHIAGRGVATLLLEAAEAAALARDCHVIRLEVHTDNAAAIARYRKSGYREFGRHAGYYQDGGDALRFEKRLTVTMPPRPVPPYFHQTTEFTCGPACLMMALGWADPEFQPAPVLEFQLWREATTIAMSGGPGGCEVYGMAVALKRRGLDPEIYVSRPGPYFLDTVKSVDKQRVMAVTQAEFRREAQELGIVTHLTPAGESVLMPAFDGGCVAIVLVSGYQLMPRGQPHWVFVFGRDGRRVLMHDPAAARDEHGGAIAPETHAVPWTAFERMTHVGRERLGAAIVIRKGPPQ